MNHLVFLDAQAGELEKILSGTKCMVLKEIDPARFDGPPVKPGDSLYFLRNDDGGALRVKATVVRVLFFIQHLDDNLAQFLKEMQPKLKLTEDQYNYWSQKQQVLLAEFETAHKIDPIYVVPNKVKAKPDWIAFEDFSLITETNKY